MDNEDFHLAGNKYASLALKRRINVKTFSSSFSFPLFLHSPLCWGDRVLTIIIIIIWPFCIFLPRRRGYLRRWNWCTVMNNKRRERESERLESETKVPLMRFYCFVYALKCLDFIFQVNFVPESCCMWLRLHSSFLFTYIIYTLFFVFPSSVESICQSAVARTRKQKKNQTGSGNDVFVIVAFCLNVFTSSTSFGS